MKIDPLFFNRDAKKEEKICNVDISCFKYNFHKKITLIVDHLKSFMHILLLFLKRFIRKILLPIYFFLKIVTAQTNLNLNNLKRGIIMLIFILELHDFNHL